MADPKPLKIGILVPSSNTALEPLTSAILASQPHITVHFSRFPVTEISLSPAALAQFSSPAGSASSSDPSAPILAAANLLADAHVDVIGWSGTSGGWLGFAADEALCAAITGATGIPSTTSTLALNRAFEVLGVKRFGLVTPYVDDVQAAIVKQYQGHGYGVRESHLGVSENWRIAAITEQTLGGQVREVVKGKDGGEVAEAEKVQAVTTFCTNLRAAHMAETWEKEFGVPMLDTVSTVVWDALRIVGRVEEAKAIKGWGKLFEL